MSQTKTRAIGLARSVAGAVAATSAIADSPAQVEDYRNSDDTKRKKKIGFFVGQVMKATQGKANPKLVNELLRKKLAG